MNHIKSFLKMAKANFNKPSRGLIALAFVAQLGISTTNFAQVPQKFNYQGVARSEQGQPLKNQNLKLKIAVLPTEDATVSEYEEIQSVKTNEFGLYSLQIGTGEVILGDMKTVKWETGNKYIRVAIDPQGGNDFQLIGTSQLLSVPYAIYADKAGQARETVGGHSGDTRSGAVSTSASGTGTTNYLTKFTAANTIYNSQIFDNGTNVGIGTATPQSRLHITTSAGNQEHLRMENLNAASWGKFIFYNDVNANYHTFTKYGSAVPGNYGSSNPLFPYANLMVFGSNNSPTVMANGHNIGFATVNGAIATFKFIGVQGTGHVGIGGNATPASSVHFNRGDLANNTLKVTNTTTGHNATDGLDIRENGNAAEIINLENSTLSLGTNNATGMIFDAANNVGIGTTTPLAKLHVQGHTLVSGMNYMFAAGTSNPDKMVIAHSSPYADYGLQYQDASDKFNFISGGTTVLNADLGNQRVGVGTNTPSYKLDVQHAGSNGILSKSTAGSSMIKIDAADANASVQLTDNGTDVWSMNNDALSGNLQFTESGVGARMVVQDGTGNVGIGQITPTYKLDLLHGGSTGIRSKSSSSFSVVDIDGESGDAAIRFAKAGANQWNLRNRPGDDYFEIYELGGGGSRVVVQDGTGNVGIGETVAPTYKLDVLHSGSTGIRSRSSASFSLMDIDAASGDAALRFIKAGVNQWNTRNNPGNDDYQIFELGGGGERLRIENGTGKVVVNGDFTAVGVKAFTIDHPLDPLNKTLVHAAIESNEVLNEYSGNITTDASGKAIVKLPDYFEAINKDFRYQLTAIGSFAQAIVSKKISNNQFEISTSSPNVEVSWEVKGVRNDKHMVKMPFVAEQEKSANQKGKYFDPIAYDQPETSRVSYSEGETSSLTANPKPVKTELRKVNGPTSVDEK